MLGRGRFTVARVGHHADVLAAVPMAGEGLAQPIDGGLEATWFVDPGYGSSQHFLEATQLGGAGEEAVADVLLPQVGRGVLENLKEERHVGIDEPDCGLLSTGVKLVISGEDGDRLQGRPVVLLSPRPRTGPRW